MKHPPVYHVNSAMTDTSKETLKKQLLTSEETLDRRLTLNVGGNRHVTWASTLERLPGTRLALLAHLGETDESYDPNNDEYFFDRNGRVFELVLQYYRTGELHVDQSACGNLLKAEFLFWNIEEQDIEACCWSDYSKYTENKNTLEDLDENFAYRETEAWGSSPQSSKVDIREPTSLQIFATRIWAFLENPKSSRAAKIYAFVSMFFVILSISVFVLETHKLFQVDAVSGLPMTERNPDPNVYLVHENRGCCNWYRASNSTLLSNRRWGAPRPVPHLALEYIDYICVSFFTIELIIRFVFAPKKCSYFKDALNIIDIICLIPHYASIILKVTVNNTGTHYSILLRCIGVLRIARILRIFKLAKHYSAFRILIYTIKVSAKELLLMIVFLLTGVLFFGSLIHFVEERNFPTIPLGIWWALVTMTTVGYGDKYPLDYLGYVLGSLCVISGVLVIAFTVPIVVNNFSLYYSHAQTRIKLNVLTKEKRRERLQALRLAAARVRPAARRRPGQQGPRPPPPPSRPYSFSKIAGSPECNDNVGSGGDGKVSDDAVTRNNLNITTSDDKQTVKEINGFNQKINEYERETEQMLAALANSRALHDNERKRQQLLLTQRREKKTRNTTATPGTVAKEQGNISGKSGEIKAFKNK